MVTFYGPTTSSLQSHFEDTVYSYQQKQIKTNGWKRIYESNAYVSTTIYEKFSMAFFF